MGVIVYVADLPGTDNSPRVTRVLHFTALYTSACRHRRRSIYRRWRHELADVIADERKHNTAGARVIDDVIVAARDLVQSQGHLDDLQMNRLITAL